MGDEDRDRRLPQRVRGEARARPSASASASSPVLSDELRQRMRAAVTAERSRTAAQEQENFPAGEVTSPSVNDGEDQAGRDRVNGAEGKKRRAVAAGTGRPASSQHLAPPARTPSPEPVVEDEITEWLGPAGDTKPAAGTPGSTPETAHGADEPADLHTPGRFWAWIALPVVAALIIGSLAVVVVRHFTGSPGNGAVSVLARQEAAARDEAAAWIAQEVSPDAIVASDPVMCHALAAYGFPSHGLLVLGPTSPDPVTAGVVVETTAVQGLFGSSLATAWAPEVLASFGSGPAAITVRVMASHGAAAYQTALGSDLADRKNAGSGLLTDPRITVPASASGQLTGGLVDARLLLALTGLARHEPITVVEFGNTGPGASAGVPLRFVDLAENDQAAHLSRTAYLRSVRAYLSTLNASIRPASMTTVVLADGQAVLRVEVTAPSPLGVFGTQRPG
jgi:hypothetical protein